MPPLQMDALLTSPQAIAYFAGHGQTITKQLIYRWRTMGKLQVADRNDKGQPLYRLRDLLEAESKTRRSPYSTRNLARLAHAG